MFGDEGNIHLVYALLRVGWTASCLGQLICGAGWSHFPATHLESYCPLADPEDDS